MKMSLLDALRHIQGCGPSGALDDGICHNAELLMYGDDGRDWAGDVPEPDPCDMLYDHFHSWPEFSGNSAYPVSLAGFTTPSGAYWSHAGKNKWEGEYGASRRRLLDHCVLQLELLEQYAAAFLKVCRSCQGRWQEPQYRRETIGELMSCTCVVLPVIQ